METIPTELMILLEKEGETLKLSHTKQDLTCAVTLLSLSVSRCCLVYSAHSIRDDSQVALKFYKRGRSYEGALQREQYILEFLKDPKHNVGESSPFLCKFNITIQL